LFIVKDMIVNVTYYILMDDGFKALKVIFYSIKS